MYPYVCTYIRIIYSTYYQTFGNYDTLPYVYCSGDNLPDMSLPDETQNGGINFMDGEVRQMNENIYINLGTIAPRGTDKAILNKYVCGKERERERER